MSKMEIKWTQNQYVDYEIIKSIENLWRIKFPKEYVEIIMYHDGSIPMVKNHEDQWKQGIIDIPCWNNETISFNNLDSNNVPEIVSVHNIHKDALPESDKIFPFAEDGGGNLLLFNYRNSSEPKIVFIDHEQIITKEYLTEYQLKDKPLIEWLEENLYFVCSSFSELIDLINPREY